MKMGTSPLIRKKQQDEAKRAANDDSNWNPIYLRTETVVGALADRFGMKKGQISFYTRIHLCHCYCRLVYVCLSYSPSLSLYVLEVMLAAVKF